MDGRTPFEMNFPPGLDRADGLPETDPAQALNVLHATPDTDSITLPGGGAFLSAEFSRDGFDLLLDAGSNGQVLIPDYFQLENPPSLKTQDGATLSPSLVESLAGPMAPAQTAQIAIDGTTPTQTDAVMGEPIGTVSEAEGQVTVTHPDGVQETLGVGDPIFQGDVLETGSDGSVNVVFVDDTVFTLDVDGRMVIDEMVYDPDSQTGTFNAQIVKGVFSMVSGQVAKTSPDGMTLDTPASTIGIRGSTLVIEMGEDGSIQNATLVRDVDGNIGEIVLVSPNGDSVVLNQFGASTSVGADGTVRPVQILSEQEVQQAHAKVLTKVVRTVARQAEQKAQQAQEKAQQSEAEAQAKQEEADAAREEAEAAQEEAAAAQAEAEAAQAEAEAALAEAEAAGDEEAIAEAQAQAAAAAEAAAEAEAAAQQAAAAQAQAEAAQQEAAQAQAQAQTAAQQAQQAQSFSSLANTAAIAQAEAEQAVIQQQGTQDGPDDGPGPDGDGPDGPNDGEDGEDGDGGDPAATAENADTVIEELPPGELPPEELPPEPLPGETEGEGELPPPDPILTDEGDPFAPDPLDPTLDGGETNDPFLTPTTTTTTTQPPPPPPTTTTTTQDNTTTTATNAVPTIGGVLNASLVYGATITLNAGGTTHLSASDADGDTLTYKLQAVPTYGTIKVNGTALVAGGTFNQAALNNGQVTYTHDNTASASDTFQLVVSDGTATSPLSTFTMQTTAWPAGTYTNPVGTKVSIADYTASSTGLVNNGTVDAVSGAITNFATISNAGTMNVSPDSAANMSMLASSSVGNSGTLNISSSFSGNLQVDFGGSALAVAATNSGTINFVDTNIAYASKLGGTWTNNGTINVYTNEGTAMVVDNLINNGVVNIAGGAEFQIATSSQPTFNSCSSIQGGDTASQATFSWSAPANLTYDGKFNPGTDGTVGNLLMSDGGSQSVNMGSTAVYNIDIAATGVAGTNYDLLAFSSGVAMNGTLNLNTIGGYSPTSGDSFAPLTYGSGLGSGSFSTISHDFGSGWVVASDYGTTALTLTVLSSAAATTGTAGNDTLLSSASNDTIDGGAGTDTLHMNGNMANYTFSFAADGTLTLTDTGSNDGTDTISNVETLKFRDTSVTISTDQPEQIVNTTTAGNQTAPQITMLSTGGWIVTWHEDSGTIKGQIYDVGGIEVGTELTLASSVTTAEHSVTEIYDSSSTGKFALTYTAADAGGDGVYYQIFNNSGTSTQGQTALNTTTTAAQDTPSIVESYSGGIFAVWTDQSSGNGEIVGRFMNSAGTADTNEFSSGTEFTVSTSNTNDQTHAQAVNLDNGDILVTWQSTHNTYSTVMGRIYDPSSKTWGSEFTIADVNNTDSGWVAADDLSNDNIAVTWLEETGTTGVYDVKAGVMDSTGTLTVSAYTVASAIDLTGNSEATPGIAGLEDGGFVVTWVDKSSSTYDIKAAIYSNTGTVVKSAFTVNSTTANAQINPKVEETVDGGFVVTWQSDGQDTDQNGIYAMRFNSNGDQVGETTLTGTSANEDFTFTSQQDGVAIDGVSGTDTVTLAGTTNDINFIKVTNIITLTGGAADDLVMIGNAIASNSMTIDLGAGEDAIKLADGGNTQTFTNVEAVIGGSGVDIVTLATALAASDNAFMEGGDGSDTLNLSSAGNNTLEIEGFENVTGGSGTDTWTSEWDVDLRGVTISGIENINLDTDNDETTSLWVSSTTSINSAVTVTGSAAANETIYSLDSANLSNVTLSQISAIYFDQDGTTSAETLTLGSTALPSGLTISGAGNDDIIQMGGTTLDLSTATVNSISSYVGTASDDTLTLNNVTGVSIDMGAGTLDKLYLANGGNTVTVSNTEEIYGGTGTDSISVTTGTSTITGGAGADTLSGGASATIYTYTTVTDSVVGAMDTINDFVAGTDKIDITILGTMAVASGTAGVLSTGDTFANLTDASLNALINSTTGTLGTTLTGDTANSEAILLRTTDSQDILAIDVDASGTIDANDTVINVTNIDTTTALSTGDFI